MPTESRDHAAEESSREKNMAEMALELMQQALDLIDANDGPHDVGAILDQSIHRLRDWLDKRVD